ncbi:hypothetical protein MBLNU457_5259t1 [Dothideomycetes sp. NU457]
MAASNYIKNVALVGATGNSGKHILSALLATGKHNITVLTRSPTPLDLPSDVHVARIDYSDPSTLTTALRGQDALIITLSGMSPPSTQTALFAAAASANVPWILPNEWSPDCDHSGLIADAPVFAGKAPARQEIVNLGKSSYIAVATGFWYEYMLPIGAATFGFDIRERKVTFYDHGETRISVSTWPQVGRAVAALLSLPVTSTGDEKGCLDAMRNKLVYINSFTVNQREILESLIRVTETKKEDWTVEKQDVRERFREGNEMAKAGDRMGFAQAMAARVFFPDGNGDFEMNRGTVNALLGLPKEDLDEFTKIAVERAMNGGGWS